MCPAELSDLAQVGHSAQAPRDRAQAVGIRPLYGAGNPRPERAFPGSIRDPPWSSAIHSLRIALQGSGAGVAGFPGLQG